MTIIQTLILSIVEGLTEFLPVSSTGHLILVSDLLRLPQTEFVKTFEIVIQAGAILAVVALYGKKLLHSRAFWNRLLIAFLPTAIVGALLYPFIKNTLLGNTTVVLVGLALGGIFLIIFERLYKPRTNPIPLENLSYRSAFLIGLTQAVSVIPGVSRAGASIVGGMLLGLPRTTAAEFSFLLAVPTILAAAALDLTQTGFVFSSQEYFMLALGFAFSFATAYLAIKTFINYLQNHTLTAFGVYRIALAILFWLIYYRA